MKRHEMPFPVEHTFPDSLIDVIERCWNLGVFDSYSENHFLIRALKNDTEYFKRYLSDHHYHNYEHFSFDFLINFNTRLRGLCQYFGDEEIQTFMQDQLSAGKANYSQNTFFEALSEIHLLFFFAVFGPSKIIKATYEPPLGPNHSNPEARFEYADGTVLDLEIKTPKFPSRDYLKNTVLPCLLLDDAGREELNSYCKQHGLSCQFPRILKFRDFFTSAAKKFEAPTSKKHINLLAINWSYTDLAQAPLFEPVHLLCNAANGLFINKEAALSLEISDEVLSKITAVFLYHLSENFLLFSDMRYLFQTRDYKIIMNPFCGQANANAVHQLTRMAVNMPSELSHDPPIFFDLEDKDWSTEFSEIVRIVNEHILL